MQRLKRLFRTEVDPWMVAEIALGTTLSILAADAAGLKYGAVAGITTLLTIQTTREMTVRSALNRYAAFLLMVALCGLTMPALGFTTPVFGLFLLLFIGLCWLLGLQDVIASNAVLATHFLLEGNMGMPLIVNAFWLLTIGAAVGLAVNLVMPYRRAPLAKYRDDIEDNFRHILRVMAQRTLCPDCEGVAEAALTVDFEDTEAKLAGYERAALRERGNRLFGASDYPVAYFQMRSRQASLLRRMWANLVRTQRSHGPNSLLANFFEETADSFGERNNALRLLAQLDGIDSQYDSLPLPRDRGEFEDRALLYAITQDLRGFLEIKRDFVAGRAPGDMDRYW